MPVQPPKPQVLWQSTTQHFSLSLPLEFDQRARAGPLRTSPHALAASPGCERLVRVWRALLKFRPVPLVSGKAKTAASAAFLGVLAVCLQNCVGCCVNVTNASPGSPRPLSKRRTGGELSTPRRPRSLGLTVASRRGLGGSCFLTVGFQPRVDQRDDAVDHGV